MSGDLILIHGRIYTLHPAQPFVSAMVVRDGKVIYTGDDAGARVCAGSGSETVDLRGYCVIPGLTDAHMHLHNYAASLAAVDVETPTLREALARVAERARWVPKGRWVPGHGWNHNVWGEELGVGEFPTTAHLDQVAPNHPVCLETKSGHAVWVNSAALAAAGITATTPDPAGGRIVRDAAGQPTGILLEGAMSLVSGIIPEPSLDELAAAMRQALSLANRAGLTGLHDMDGSLAFQAEQLLRERGELSARVIKSIPLEHLDEAIGVGLRSGFGDDWLRVGQVKMFADGALGPMTAWMLEGFETAPANTGIATTPIEVLREATGKANAAGLGCAIHAIGDRACREVLNVYGEFRPQFPAARNRIEHVQLLHPDDMGRLAQLNVIASMQPIHATSDMHIADRYWGKRSAGAYAYKSQLSHGAVLALGSDCPVEVISPLIGLHAAVTRRRADGTPGPEGWYPEQRLTVAEAVRGFTWGPAYAAGMEDRLGSLQAGKLADMTILDQDIFTMDPMEILHAQVRGTVVGGRFVWRADEL